jgi:hypothetical protein
MSAYVDGLAAGTRSATFLWGEPASTKQLLRNTYNGSGVQATDMYLLPVVLSSADVATLHSTLYGAPAGPGFPSCAALTQSEPATLLPPPSQPCAGDTCVTEAQLPHERERCQCGPAPSYSRFPSRRLAASTSASRRQRPTRSWCRAPTLDTNAADSSNVVVNSVNGSDGLLKSMSGTTFMNANDSAAGQGACSATTSATRRRHSR